MVEASEDAPFPTARPAWMRSVTVAAFVVLVLSGLVGAAGFWAEESWWVLVPAATFGAAVAALVRLLILVPSGRWNARSLQLAGGAPGKRAALRRLAFGAALFLAALGLVGGVRGILGQWDDPIIVGLILLGSGGAVLEMLRRPARRSAR